MSNKQSNEIRPRVYLPPNELTDVYLLPSKTLERLEEYRSDENIVYLLIGLFGGAILGILSNWATNDPFVITKLSVLLLFIFASLTMICAAWALRLHQRATTVKKGIFHQEPVEEKTH